MIVVGVDSAETTGVAVLDGDRLVKRGTVKIAGYADVERVADKLATYEPDLVAVEDCFVRVNAAAGLTLARLLGRWLQAFERRQIATTTVLASTWQPMILAGRMTTRTPGPERKLAAIAWALEAFGVTLSEDIADACAIAVWARDHVHRIPSGVGGRSRGTESAASQGAATPAHSPVRNCPTGGQSP